MRTSSIFAIIGLVAFLFMGLMHEEAHVQIYRNYNIKSHVDIIHSLPSFSTMAESKCNNDLCELGHSINETVGYHLEALFILIYFGFYCILLKMEEKWG